MKLKMNQDIQRMFPIEKDKTYEVVDVIQDSYKIVVPMKQKGKFRYALVKDEEGELID